MKTNIKTILTICVLGFIGLNTNAANFRNAGNSVKVENSGSVQFFLNEDVDAIVDFKKEAQMVTKWIADKEEAKAVQKLIDAGLSVSNEGTASFENEATTENIESNLPALNEDTETTADFQKEAQLVTKWVADNEEVKAVKKLIGEGKLGENK